MQQPDMFHKYDLNGYTYDNNIDADDDDDDFNINNKNSRGPIIADIQKQQAKKTARLSKNNISVPNGVMLHNYIKLAGVQANPAKRIVTLSSNKMKCDPKMLSNMRELLQTNRMEGISLMFEATLDCYQGGNKSDEHEQKCLQLLKKALKDISHNIIGSTLKVKIKSMAQEFHAAFCDADLDPYKADKVIRDRLDVLKQQLQHQINDECQFDGKCPCLRQNLSSSCKIKNCPRRHV